MAACGPEIPQQNAVRLSLPENVVRIEIAVKDATLMEMRPRLRHSQCGPPNRGAAETARFGINVPSTRIQRRRTGQIDEDRVDKLHDQGFGALRMIAAPSQNGHQIRMPPGGQTGGHLGPRESIRGQGAFENLYGHLTPGFRGSPLPKRFVDHAGRALSQRFKKPQLGPRN